MTDQVLNILKFVLLGLLYLFFARVLWAVWSEVRPPRQRAGQSATTAGAQAVGPPLPPATAASGHPAGPASSSGDSTGGAGRKPPKGRRGRVARLMILEPRSRRGTAIALTGEITIGRGEHCGLVVDDDTYVSQLHARIYDYEGQPMVEDLGSTNGTFHNGNRLHGSRLLHPGDRVQVGSTVIEAQ